MWAQLSTVRVKDVEPDTIREAMEQLREFEQPDSGLLRTLVMADQSDPTRVLVLVLFESEEQARARESDPRREPGVMALRERLAGALDGPPQYTDLHVLADLGPAPSGDVPADR